MKLILIVFLSLFSFIKPIYAQEFLFDTIISEIINSPTPLMSTNCTILEKIQINDKEYTAYEAKVYLTNTFKEALSKDNGITMYLIVDSKQGLTQVIVKRIKYPKDLDKIKAKFKGLKIAPMKQKCYTGNSENRFESYEESIGFSFPIKIN
jgi:hypothetical protein